MPWVISAGGNNSLISVGDVSGEFWTLWCYSSCPQWSRSSCCWLNTQGVTGFKFSFYVCKRKSTGVHKHTLTVLCTSWVYQSQVEECILQKTHIANHKKYTIRKWHKRILQSSQHACTYMQWVKKRGIKWECGMCWSVLQKEGSDCVIVQFWKQSIWRKAFILKSDEAAILRFFRLVWVEAGQDGVSTAAGWWTDVSARITTATTESTARLRSGA